MAYTEIDEDNLQYYSLRSNKSAKLHFYNDNKKMNLENTEKSSSSEIIERKNFEEKEQSNLLQNLEAKTIFPKQLMQKAWKTFWQLQWKI